MEMSYFYCVNSHAYKHVLDTNTHTPPSSSSHPLLHPHLRPHLSPHHPPPLPVIPWGNAVHTHTDTQHTSTHRDKCTTVPKLNSIYQSCCIECIIYIHKWSFILILNYILCFMEMHCVKRIKCCGWINKVTFLYHPGSLFPPNHDVNER